MSAFQSEVLFESTKDFCSIYLIYSVSIDEHKGYPYKQINNCLKCFQSSAKGNLQTLVLVTSPKRYCLVGDDDDDDDENRRWAGASSPVHVQGFETRFRVGDWYSKEFHVGVDVSQGSVLNLRFFIIIQQTYPVCSA